MLRSYSAVYEHGGVRWLDAEPAIAEGEQAMVVVDARRAEVRCGRDLDAAWDQAWGAWGAGKTLDEIDREIDEQRVQDWERSGWERNT